MAQYNKRSNSFLPHGTSLFEVVMLADAEGNINSGGGNFSGTAVDAFGRARMSQPITLFDSTNLSESGKYNYVATGTANNELDAAQSRMILNVGSDSGDKVVSQTKRRFSYQPGKSLLFLTTFVFGAAKENVRRREGYFDENNGIYLEQTNDGIYFVLRTNTSGSITETRVEQADWNGDRLNGIAEESTSGITLDLSKSQILWGDIEWLGVGSVRIGFIINGQIIIAHTFHNANINPDVYMQTPNLPIRSEIENTGATASASDMSQICASVISEGGYDPRAVKRMIGTATVDGITTPSTKNVWVSLATIKLADVNRIVVPAGADILNIANADFEYGLFVNATPNTAFTFANTTNAVVTSLDVRQLTGLGTRVAGGYLGGKTAPITIADGTFNWDYQLGSTIAGVSDTLTLAVRTSSASSSVAGIIKWYEL